MGTVSGWHDRTSLLFLFLRGSKFLFLLSICASAAVAALNMVTPQVIRAVVDGVMGDSFASLPALSQRILNALSAHSSVDLLRIAALAVVITALLTACFQYLANMSNIRATERMTQRMRNLLFSHLQQLPASWYHSQSIGDILQRCTSDIQTVRNFVSEQLVEVLRVVILIVFSLAMTTTMNAKLSLVLWIAAPLIFAYSFFFYRHVGTHFRKCDEQEGILSGIVQENLSGVRVVRAFAKEEAESKRFEKQNNDYNAMWMALCRLLCTFWSFNHLITGLQLMILVSWGTVLCVGGELTAGELIAFISYDSILIWPVKRIGRILSEMSKASVSLNRIQEILGAPAESDEAALTPDLTGEISVRNLTFSWPGQDPVLKDVSFDVPAGSTVGILGGTGSGKSTLARLLVQLNEAPADTILLDGVPIEQIRLSWLRKHVGLVLQEPMLFTGTIRENIKAAGSFSEESLRQAARDACVDHNIMEFAAGYDTIVGEGGVTLSGGQRQRISIARMLLNHPAVIIFDDSLSAVDAGTDDRIRRALRTYRGKTTMIYISHRISTLQDADQILVLEGGILTARGNHEELLESSAYYRKIYEIQARMREEPT